MANWKQDCWRQTSLWLYQNRTVGGCFLSQSQRVLAQTVHAFYCMPIFRALLRIPYINDPISYVYAQDIYIYVIYLNIHTLHYLTYLTLHCITYMHVKYLYFLYMHACLHAYIHTYIHACMHTYTYLYVYTIHFNDVRAQSTVHQNTWKTRMFHASARNVAKSCAMSGGDSRKSGCKRRGAGVE